MSHTQQLRALYASGGHRNMTTLVGIHRLFFVVTQTEVSVAGFHYFYKLLYLALNSLGERQSLHSFSTQQWGKGFGQVQTARKSNMSFPPPFFFLSREVLIT